MIGRLLANSTLYHRYFLDPARPGEATIPANKKEDAQ